MVFEGWALPSGCMLAEGEKESVESGDLPPLSILDFPAGALGGTMASLREARRVGLARLPVAKVIEAVDRVAQRFLDPGDDLRKSALEAMASHAGFSPPMARAVLDGMALDWTRARLEALLRSEFPDPGVLDGFRPGPVGGELRAAGYPLTFHLGAGTVPGVGTTSLIRSLLVKSAVLLKPGRGDVVLPVLFARGLMEVEPEVGGGVAVLYWPSSDEEKTEAAIEGAEMVVVYGGDETVRWVGDRMPPTKALRAYRHRMGVGLVGKGALGKREIAMAAARAVSLFDQRGCVSPHLFLVEEGGETEPADWARLLAQSLEKLEEDLPSGPVTPQEGAALQQLRGEAEVAEALGKGFVRHGGGEAPWTVLFQPDGRVEPSCLGRTVRVIPVPELEDGLALLQDWGAQLQTVGVAGLGEARQEILDGLVALGVSRITSLAGVPWPPPWWHHDGEGPLRALVRWTNLEAGSEEDQIL
jgi:hypothetical protein